MEEFNLVPIFITQKLAVATAMMSAAAANPEHLGARTKVNPTVR